MLRIEKCSEGRATTVRPSGRIQAENLPELDRQIESCTLKPVLNLEDVLLVDRAVIRFLGAYESNGVELQNCPLYIREWILRESAREPG